MFHDQSSFKIIFTKNEKKLHEWFGTMPEDSQLISRVLFILQKLHKEKGWTFQLEDWKGGGLHGQIFEISKQNCPFILKITDNYTREAAFTEHASRLGVAPKVLIAGSEGTWEYIIMDLLIEDLIETYPYQAIFAVNALELYYKLLQNGIRQNDLKIENLMLDSYDRLYLIDYSLATEASADDAMNKQNMWENATLLLKSMFGHAYDYTLKPSPWIEEEDEQIKFNIISQCTNAVRDWCQSHGIDKEIKLYEGTDTDPDTDIKERL